MKRLLTLIAPLVLYGTCALAGNPHDAGTDASLRSTLSPIGQQQAAPKGLPASGSLEAARLVAIRYMNIMYGAPVEKVQAVVLESTATSAIVRAVFSTQSCALTVVKNLTVNEYGWAVQIPTCEVIK